MVDIISEVKVITVGDLGAGVLSLNSDLAAEFPLYVYLDKNKNTLAYSFSIGNLLKSKYVVNPLTVSSEGVSFFLQSGVVPPPMTIYENIYILGIGDSAQVKEKNGQILLEFHHAYPFFNSYRCGEDKMRPDDNFILEMLANAMLNRIDTSRPTFLFHSAGKDSNALALALAEAGLQEKVTLITQKAKGEKDESFISGKIAEKLGFRHVILYEPIVITSKHRMAINDYFEKASFPCSDHVSLAYPLYGVQLPELYGANIIDGMGNDVYIGHVPGRAEYSKQKLSPVTSRFRFVSDRFRSDSIFNPLGNTKSEFCGLSGFRFKDLKQIYPQGQNVHSHWRNESEKRKGWDYFDLRGDIRGCFIDTEIHTRKVRNACEMWESRLILPWANQRVAEYFSKLSEKHLVDRSKFKNKIFLREMLKKRIGLDSDVLGKKGYHFDFFDVIINRNRREILDSILNSPLFGKKSLNHIDVLFKNIDHCDSLGIVSFRRKLILRLFVLASWYQKGAVSGRFV